MRAVVQRVSRASVTVAGEVVGQIEAGLLVYVATAADDTDTDLQYIADKVANLRIFLDADGKMNRSVLDVAGGVLVISAFALYGDARKGRRPSFIASAPAETAAPRIDQFVEMIRAYGLPVATGQFRAHMDVASVNDGPITILLDSQRAF